MFEATFKWFSVLRCLPIAQFVLHCHVCTRDVFIVLCMVFSPVWTPVSEHNRHCIFESNYSYSPLLSSLLFSTFVSLCLYCSRESISRPVQHHLSDKHQDTMTSNLTTNMMISADYLVRVNEMKGRQNAVFESKSVRDQFESNARHNVSPGWVASAAMCHFIVPLHCVTLLNSITTPVAPYLYPSLSLSLTISISRYLYPSPSLSLAISIPHYLHPSLSPSLFLIGSRRRTTIEYWLKQQLYTTGNDDPWSASLSISIWETRRATSAGISFNGVQDIATFASKAPTRNYYSGPSRGTATCL